MFELIKTLRNNSSKSIKQKQADLYNNIIDNAIRLSKEGYTYLKIIKESNSILDEIHYDEVMKRVEQEGFKVVKSTNPTLYGEQKIYNISWRGNNE